MNIQQAENELSFIKKVIVDSKKATISNGLNFIIWGILLMITVIITHFLIEERRFTDIKWVWRITVGAGILYNVLVYTFRRSKKQFIAATQKYLTNIWIACGIASALVIFTVHYMPLDGWLIYDFMAIIFGIGFFSCGIIYNLLWLRLISIGWWAGSIVITVCKGYYSEYIFCGLILLFQIIPGILMYLKSKREITASV